ncbi:MAG: Uma2 family endonuclease [Amaricoccus sp.]
MNQHDLSVRSPATYQDVLDAPEGMVAELIHGSLHLHPRPESPHARASSMLGVRIGGPFDGGLGGPGGWWVIDGPELHLDQDVLVLDLAGWRRERVPKYPSAPCFDLAPDWACEILSPSTRAIDLTDKRALYAAAGIPFLWPIDPVARTLEAFVLREGAWTLVAALKEDEAASVAPFDAVSFPLSVLWPD